MKRNSFDKRTWARIAAFASAALLIFIFLPRPDEKKEITYELNRPWTEAQLISAVPFTCLYLDDDVLKFKEDSIAQNTPNFYRYDDKAEKEILNAITNSTLSKDEKERARRIVKKVYADGVVDNSGYEDMARKGSFMISVISSKNDNVSDYREMPSARSMRMAYKTITDSIGWRSESLQLGSLVTPNFILDSDYTQDMIDKKKKNLELDVIDIQAGQSIIERGEIVTPRVANVLETYKGILAEQQVDKPMSGFNITIGQILMSIVLMAGLYFFLLLYRPAYLKSLSKTLCLLTLLVSFFIMSVIVSRGISSGIYIVPFAILPILVVVFYDTSTAIFMLVLEIALCAAFAAYPFEFVFVQLTGGIVAIFSMQELSRRSQLLRTAAFIFVAYVVSYAAVELSQVASLSSFSWLLIGYFAINIVLTSFAYILIFVVEKLFGMTSVVTLVELSDINNPLLRELSMQCPGTFQHSMAVANLATNAAHAVGANVQLVRAGALYHDIGKLDNPAFFTENQHGVNPHTTLNDAKLSAKMIIGHVTGGLKRAEKANLPRVIRDLIVQHHGKSTARYFYNTYCNNHPGQDVDPAPFTYPGPNPQTKEASLLMMADVVEAASRSLTEHTPEAIASLVNRLIDMQVAEGLHRESPLSFRDISVIKEAFIESLRTMYHTRIAYPDRK